MPLNQDTKGDHRWRRRRDLRGLGRGHTEKKFMNDFDRSMAGRGMKSSEPSRIHGAIAQSLRRHESRPRVFHTSGRHLTCKSCKTLYIQRGGPTGRFCCRKCRDSFFKKPKGIREFPCIVCGRIRLARMANTKFCSPKCRARSYMETPKDFDGPMSCASCGKTIIRKCRHHKFCSRKCNPAFKANRFLHKMKRHRLIVGSPEKFTHKEIFERDGYRCQKCGRKTRPDFNIYHKLYPVLDHIIPLSKQGEHSRLNCRCLCRGCNAEKKNVIINEQLRLLG